MTNNQQYNSNFQYTSAYYKHLSPEIYYDASFKYFKSLKLVDDYSLKYYHYLNQNLLHDKKYQKYVISLPKCIRQDYAVHAYDSLTCKTKKYIVRKDVTDFKNDVFFSKFINDVNIKRRNEFIKNVYPKQ